MRAAIARGKIGVAQELLDSLGRGADPGTGFPAALLLLARAELRAAAGRPAEARHDFIAAGERVAWLPLANPEVLGWRTGLALCESALGNGEEARRPAEEAVRLAREAGGPRGIGLALRVLGTVTPGEEGIELLREASEVLAGTRARLLHAEALVELGAALRRANRRREAREPLREGLDLAHRCGAAPLEERAREELKATGARPRKAVLSGVESLTPSELRVARLAAEGMTNREIAQSLFVTAKTVETHLRHAYQKLDVARPGLAETLGGVREESGAGGT
jgi:DNA-binding CsgD family transcriptional regulator